MEVKVAILKDQTSSNMMKMIKSKNQEAQWALKRNKTVVRHMTVKLLKSNNKSQNHPKKKGNMHRGTKSKNEKIKQKHCKLEDHGPTSLKYWRGGTEVGENKGRLSP